MTDVNSDDDPIERGAAEDASGVPVTPTDVQASQSPPSRPGDESQPGGPVSEPPD